MPQKKLPKVNSRRYCAGVLGLLFFGSVVFGIWTYLKNGSAKSGPHGTSSYAVTFRELSQHGNQEDCWMAVHGSVFDVTDYASHHPDPDYIIQCCGIDCTLLYDSVHPASLLTVIRRRRVGSLDVTEDDPTNLEKPEKSLLPEIQYDELLEHHSLSDCWMAIYDIVYDVTKYAPFHPNPHYVTDYCGLEVSDLFDGAHNKSAVKVVQQRIVGKLVSPTTTTNQSAPSNLPSSFTPSSTPTPRPTFVDVSDALNLLLGLQNEP